MSSAPEKVIAIPSTSTKPQKVRFVTAASLFDGHDAAINIMRRILQSSGAEVIHLGHNRSVAEIVDAAVQEDAHAIALSSYQGGHVEYLKYMVDMLKHKGRPDIRVFAGGGGVIIPAEIRELEAYGVTRIYSPEDGQAMGLQGLIADMLERCQYDPGQQAPTSLEPLSGHDTAALASLITALENDSVSKELRVQITQGAAERSTPVLGITGTGGSGKSSLTDEIIRRFRLDHGDKLRIAVIAVDPTRRKTGGSLLGDRIRMNAIDHPNIYMRSIATRDSVGEIPAVIGDVIAACKLCEFDFIIVETPGIGQGDAAIVPLVDTSLYVMTPEFGAQSQLEKIDMLDFADIVAINKFDRKGAEDAYRDVCKQVQRNREAFSQAVESMPVFGTIASRFNDDGTSALYQEVMNKLGELGLEPGPAHLPRFETRRSTGRTVIVPSDRVRYLAEIATTVRDYHDYARQQVALARERQQLGETRRMLIESKQGSDTSDLDALIAKRETALDSNSQNLLQQWPEVRQRYSGDEYVVKIRDREIRTDLKYETLSGSSIPKVSLPAFEDHGELLKWLLLENLPGSFPFTAGVFAFKARKRGSNPDVCRRRRCVSNQSSFQETVRAFGGEASFDRISTR